MKLEVIKNALTSKVGRQIITTQKHSPTILFAAGVVGVVTTTVLACKATLKLEEVLQEVEDERSLIEDFDPSAEVASAANKRITMKGARKVAKLYAPSVAVGVISISALTGSHVVLSKRNAAVMAAYSALDRGFNDYRDRVREELGEEKELEFRHGTDTVEEKVEGKNGKTKTVEHKVVKGVPSIYARFFDDSSTSWSRTPEYNQVFLNCQQNYANDLLKARGHVFLNEVYDMLGITRTKAGAVVGWVYDKDGDNFIDFGIFDEDQQRNRLFVNGEERSILLDFNVDGVIYDLI